MIETINCSNNPIFRIVSRGVTKSNLYFNATLEKWLLQSIIDKDHFLESDSSNFPIGTTQGRFLIKKNITTIFQSRHFLDQVIGTDYLIPKLSRLKN